jgi:hypothetical protein
VEDNPPQHQELVIFHADMAHVFGASIAKMLIDVSELRAWQALDLCGSTNPNFNSNQRF